MSRHPGIKLFSALLCLAAGAGFVYLITAALQLEIPSAANYTARAVAETGSINVPTAILMDYRGFDTLGEASVIFTSVAVVLVILGAPQFSQPDRIMTLLSRRAIAYLLPLFFLFPVYVILNGHLSPGGGFQGGVSLAVLVILLHVVFGNDFTAQRLPMRLLGITEYLSALAFASVGLVGIALGSTYLANAAAGLPLGRPGELLSAGIIPLLNVIVGCKVAAGLSSIFYALAGHTAEDTAEDTATESRQ
ncbi:hydrogen gas-evolving membrane-bound hydrogenase subunit E [Spirochaeta africana]|uniref:Multisubunit Na+/H+ antiporter, MnhB subunit n=1 Tax=Spirochaeta africana (strain ATCC 700263 / DSM 8902 / Z-7692) TaxID=889378 RepID=H9ULG4_SPIAZ|nr:hydrogen gas-evolving membrane-bound hydrogenase subunit E [Spirochaeta africana]AFG38357.1 multisubunit Na+/H+ antiporter, MnhB subunit [Spirochaeta africana DSM 8902]